MDLTNLRFEAKFFPALQRIQECLCVELERAGGPELCFCGLIPAGMPPLGLLDCAKGSCGVAWVSPSTAYPSRAFPNPDEGNIPCSSPLAMTISVGVARCHPTPRGTEAQAGVQKYFEATALYLSDMAAVRRALLCCEKKDPDLSIALGSWETIEPSGGVSGGVWTATLG